VSVTGPTGDWTPPGWLLFLVVVGVAGGIGAGVSKATSSGESTPAAVEYRLGELDNRVDRVDRNVRRLCQASGVDCE